MSSPTVSEVEAPVRAAETAPSSLAANEPTLARVVGLIGCMLITLGFAVIFMNEVIGPRLLGKPVGAIAIAVGFYLQLFHALRDHDIQIRRAYGMFAYALLVLMVILIIPNSANFLKYGWCCALAGLGFFLTFARHETDPVWKKRILATLGIVGALMAAIGLLGGIIIGDIFQHDATVRLMDRLGIGFLSGFIVNEFLVTYGLILALVGLAYLCAFVSQTSPTGPLGYKAGLAIGGMAIFVILYAALRSALPPLFKMDFTAFFVPNGLVLLALGAVYGVVAMGIVSENSLVVLTRRELAGYFYSPIAYLVMLAMALLGALSFFQFITFLRTGPRLEPIVRDYFQNLPPLVVVFLVPAITMRLLAEEKRTGTYEVLMCAPVKETAVVFSKFFACLIFFMMLWGIWSLYLLGLAAASAEEFKYRPLLSFYLALAFSGAVFISMGLFFSSLSKNQVIAAVLTFVGMLALLLIVVMQQYESTAAIWRAAFNRLSYYVLWDAALQGRLMVRDLILQGSFTFFWLFLTVKVLEARRWS